MVTRDLPDIYARAPGPVALGLGHMYQANPSWPWYNYYIQYTDNKYYRHVIMDITWLNICYQPQLVYDKWFVARVHKWQLDHQIWSSLLTVE